MSRTAWILLCLITLAPVLGQAATSKGHAPSKAPSPRATPTASSMAPLDRYFGAMRMSPIGIRQQIGYLGRNYTWRTMTDEQIVHDAEWIEEALRDWQARFPNDSWLPPTAYHLEGLYQELQSPDARQHAARMLRYIVEHWPNSKYAHVSRIRLAQGFPPLHEEPSMRPTPLPTPSPTPSGMTPTPEPTPTPTEEPTASPSPSPSPTPQKRHGLFGR